MISFFKINENFKEFSNKHDLVIIFVVILLFNLAQSKVLNSFGVDIGSSSFKSYGFAVDFLVVVIFAPFFETIITTVLPITVFRFLIKNEFLLVLVSGIFFALIHPYSIYYMVFTYLAGLTFNGYYLYIGKRKNFIVSGILIILLHAVHNFIALTVNSFT